MKSVKDSSIKESMEFFKSFIEFIPLPFYIKNERFEYIEFNQASLDILGLEISQVKNKTVFEILPENVAQKHHQSDLSLIRKKNDVIEDKGLASDGIIHHITIYKTAIFDKDEEFIGIVGIIIDETDNKNLLEMVIKEKVYGKTLLDAFPFLAWYKDKESKFLTTNKSFQKVVEQKYDYQVIGKTDLDFFDKEMADKYIKDDKEVMNSGESKVIKEKLKISGEYKWIETFKSPVYDEKGELLGTVGYAKDIDEKVLYEDKLKKLNKSLEEEKEKYKDLLNAIPDMVWVKDEKGVYTYCNEQFEKLFGVKYDEVIGKTDYDFENKEIADSFRLNDKKAMDSSSPVINYENLVFADGHEEFCQTIKSAIRTKNDKFIGVLGICRNFDDLKVCQQNIEALNK